MRLAGLRSRRDMVRLRCSQGVGPFGNAALRLHQRHGEKPAEPSAAGFSPKPLGRAHFGQVCSAVAGVHEDFVGDFGPKRVLVLAVDELEAQDVGLAWF